jgi:hypothetical protein
VETAIPPGAVCVFFRTRKQASSFRAVIQQIFDWSGVGSGSEFRLQTVERERLCAHSNRLKRDSKPSQLHTCARRKILQPGGLFSCMRGQNALSQPTNI